MEKSFKKLNFNKKIFSAKILTQLACLNGANGLYVRHISSGAPKRSHFSSSRRQTGTHHEISSATTNGSAGSAKKRVSLNQIFL
jgi:hypothetical protein